MIDVNESKLIALCRDLDLSLVVLFGSQAQGQARDDSDIDIAVLSDRVGDQALESDYQAKVWESFLWLFSRADVDVIFLNQVSSLLGYKISQTGQIIYEARPRLWHNFKLLAAKRYSDAQKFFDLKKRRIKLDAIDLYMEGVDLYGKGKHTEAIEKYKKAIEMDPEFPEAYVGLGHAYEKQGKLDEAVKAIKKAVELAPEDPMTHMSLSMMYQKKGMIREAEMEQMESRRLTMMQQ